LDGLSLEPVQFEISDFGFEMQESSNFKILIDGFTVFLTPGESIGWPLQADHKRSVFSGNTRRTSHDNTLIADFERLSVQALVAQLAHAAPFNGPTLLSAAIIRCQNMDEGMRIPEYELHDHAFEVHFFADVVRRGIRMVSISGRGCQQRGGKS
jgi:hypothetical protein